MLYKKKGQVSLEFSILLLAILTISIVSIYYFLNNNFDDKDRVLDKIDIGAKTAVSLVNSRYNGTYNRYPITYLGITYDDSMTNITIHVSTNDLSDSAKNFIINYTYNSQKINRSMYSISVKYQK